MKGITFDAGGLIALEGNDRKVIALLARAAELGVRVTIPATAVGLLLAQTATVVICAQRGGQPVVTSDAGDLRGIDPNWS